jgi:DNA processing protein
VFILKNSTFSLIYTNLFLKFRVKQLIKVEINTLTHQIALTLLSGIGPVKARLLVAKMGSLEAVFKASLISLHKDTGIGKSVLKNMSRNGALERAKYEVEYILKENITTHFYSEINYPRRLKHCDDAPLLLFSKGNFNPNPNRVIAVVGTRNATNYGKKICEEFIQHLAGYNIQIVSGMAYGIDICAHAACVQNQLETVGVLGHGLDRLYPSVHRKTADKMLQNGGLLSEFLPGTNPDRENFPMRNRIVAGMVDAVVVIESKKSGGSLITADLANDYSKDVFAFPGNVDQIFSEGCNLLIQQQKAHLLLNGQQFLKEMNWLDEQKANTFQRSCFIDLSEEEQAICTILEKQNGEHIDVLAFRTKTPISKMNVLLFHLEMKGVVQALPGKKYQMI